MKIITSEQLATIFTIDYPVKNPIITQGWGLNNVPYYKQLGYLGHNGIDFRASNGTDCFAAFTGIATYVGTDSGGGNEIRIQSGQMILSDTKFIVESIYYHLESFNIKQGDHISRGQLIAKTDNTGRYTSGAHLHFGIKILYWDNVNKYWMKDYNNGYGGAINPFPLFSQKSWEQRVKDFTLKYEMRLVKSIMSPAVFLIRKGKRYWFQDEKVFKLFYTDFDDVSQHENDLINAIPYGGEIQLKEFI